MSDRRSLCDRSAPARSPNHDDLSDEQFEAHVLEQSSAPSCGACIVVASHIRKEAGLLVAQTLRGSRAFFPTTPAEAYRLLATTRWGTEFDPEPPEQLESASFYRDCIVDRYTDRWLDIAATEESDEASAWLTQVNESRRKWLESSKADGEG